MRLSLPLGVAILVLAASTAMADPCDPRQPGRCIVPKVDLSAVPEISQQIVAEEPKKPQGKAPALRAPDPAAPYTGPTFGVTRAPRPTPTVGYHWSLD
jgi:hypothetical protein